MEHVDQMPSGVKEFFSGDHVLEDAAWTDPPEDGSITWLMLRVKTSICMECATVCSGEF